MKRPIHRALTSSSAGLTLLEIMIATGILTIALVMSLGSVISISTASDSTADQAVAMATVASVLEQIQTLSFDEVMAYYPGASSELGATTAISLVCYDTTGTPVSMPCNPEDAGVSFPNPMEAQVTVVWRDLGGRPRTMRASTMLMR
ncbi:MAG: hypothetical protein GY851_05660 [bacterium]|nr:hypothetical protein [bacterium]